MKRQQQQWSASEVRVIMVGGDPVFRDSMVDLLTRQGYTAAGLGTAGDFYQQLFTERCDLAIIDIDLADQSGLVLGEYVRKNSKAGIIMLSSSPDIETRLAGYGSGADVCLVKPVDARELLAIISGIIDRMAVSWPERAPSPSAAETAGSESQATWRLFRTDWTLRTPKDEIISLTAKEYDFMISLVLQSASIVTRQYILKTLGYEPNEMGNRALESLIYRLRRKTEATGYGFPVKTYRGIGYCLASPVVLS